MYNLGAMATSPEYETILPPPGPPRDFYGEVEAYLKDPNQEQRTYDSAKEGDPRNKHNLSLLPARDPRTAAIKQDVTLQQTRAQLKQFGPLPSQLGSSVYYEAHAITDDKASAIDLDDLFGHYFALRTQKDTSE